MRPVMRFVLAVILPLLILTIPALAAPASTITVCPLGCDYTAIQPAIDAATSGDTILIGAGTFTEQLTLKSDLTLTAQAGPTQTVVTALASPIISGSNLSKVTLESLGVKGNGTIAEPIGIELINSTVVVSNVIVSDLHGANGTGVYTNGLDAIGLRISGTFSVTLFNSVIEDITGGDADVNSEGRGGDGIGVSAAGEGQLTIISSTVRNLAGGAAGMQPHWPGCITCCNGAGGRSLGINKEGTSDLGIEHTRLEGLMGGRPCTGVYGPNCRFNAGQTIGVRAVSGTLNLISSVIIDLLTQTSYTNIPSIAVSTTHSDDVYIADTEIARLNVLESPLRTNRPASPYCAPPPNSAIGIASSGDSTVQIVRSTLLNIVGKNIGGYSVGISTRASQAITLTGNRIAQLSGGTTLPWWIPVAEYQACGIDVSASLGLLLSEIT